MKALAALILTAAAVIALASHEAGAVAPMQSPVPTRSRWRDLPATPTTSPTPTATRSRWRPMPATPTPIVTVVVRPLDQHERHPNATRR